MAKAKTQEQEAVTFFSKYAKLRMVITPRGKQLIDGRFVSTPGKTAEFDRGQFTTSDPEVIDFLRNDRAYGMDYFESQEELAATVQPEKNVSGNEELEVTKPRSKAGQRATVKAKATTSEDLDADAEGAASDEDDI